MSRANTQKKHNRPVQTQKPSPLHVARRALEAATVLGLGCAPGRRLEVLSARFELSGGGPILLPFAGLGFGFFLELALEVECAELTSA